MTKIILILIFFLFSSVVYARTIRVSDCIITIGSFCVIESFLAVIFGIILIFFNGLPLRFFLGRYLRNKLNRNRNYKPSNLILKIYSNAYIISWFILSCFITFYFGILK